MQFIGDRWKIIIIAYLMLGNKNFMELKESIEDISQNILIKKLEELIDCGLIYNKDVDEDCYCLTKLGKRFERLFTEYIKKYGMKDMYSAGFYPFDTQEEKWAYWSRHIYYNRYDIEGGKPYVDLLNIVQNKNYFVITTNVDSQFMIAGFPKEKTFATQDDYG